LAFSGDVGLALQAALQADAALSALMPDGVWWDLAKAGKTRVVIIKLMHHEPTDMFGACAFEEALYYLVKAVDFDISAVRARDAAKRIDALLNGGTLAVPGYVVMQIQFNEEVHYAEPDPANPEGRVNHWGGTYRVTVSPIN
jgi:hypothetical protein